MIYKVGMLCKHFKGSNLLEKNIYRIEKLNVKGIDILGSNITYTGDYELINATNLVIYSNIFQEEKLFAREYEDISSELTIDKQELYHQKLKVEPLNLEEIEIIGDTNFIKEKKTFILKKFE